MADWQKCYDSVRLSALACPQGAPDPGAAGAAIEERDAGGTRGKEGTQQCERR